MHISDKDFRLILLIFYRNLKMLISQHTCVFAFNTVKIQKKKSVQINSRKFEKKIIQTFSFYTQPWTVL